MIITFSLTLLFALQADSKVKEKRIEQFTIITFSTFLNSILFELAFPYVGNFFLVSVRERIFGV